MQQTYRFDEEVFADRATGDERVRVEKGTTFTATLAEAIAIDRRGKEPKEVKTGRQYVTSADVDILPGCLTSCIRTGRAVPVDEPKAKSAKAAK